MDNKRDHKRGRKSQKIACSSVKHVLWLRITIYYFVSVFGLGDTHHCLWKATEVKGVFVILHRQSLFGSIIPLRYQTLQLASSSLWYLCKLFLSRSFTLVVINFSFSINYFVK